LSRQFAGAATTKEADTGLQMYIVQSKDIKSAYSLCKLLLTFAALCFVSAALPMSSASAQTTFTVDSVPDTWTAIFSDADGRTITVRMDPRDGACAAFNAAGYAGAFARSSVAACDRTIVFEFETNGFLVQSINFTDIDDVDGTAPRDSFAMNVAGTWTSPTIEIHSFASPPAYANQAGRLVAAGAVGTFLANDTGENPTNETATFTMAVPTTTFQMLFDDAQDGRNALVYFDLNDLEIVTAEGSVIAVDDAASAPSNAGGTDILNVFDGDTLNTVDASPTNTTLAVAPGSTVPAGITFDTITGDVSVAAGTPIGEYSFDYQICEIGFPTNCETATATVTVTGDVDLSITKTNTPGVNGEVDQTNDTVTSGDTTTYTIIVTSNGPDPVTGAVVTDSPGAGITCDAAAPVTITGDGVPSGSFTFSDLSSGGITLGTLSTGQSTTFSYSCQVN
jgi:uncharacterized repeat protein (TIGR01451 family)